MLADPRVPESVRQSLSSDYQQVQDMLERLQHQQVHIAVFGRVSVGKSALLNALLGERRFSTSPLHGETKEAAKGRWQEVLSGNVYLIDTPGINEVGGEAREQLAKDVANRAELVLFVVDGDITETELNALRVISAAHRPIILVLNKADRYTQAERESLLASLARHTQGLVAPEHIVLASANPPEQIVIRTDADGNEQESTRQPPPEVAQVKRLLWDILEAEGETLAALNASLFASSLSDEIGQRIVSARSGIAERWIHLYATAKGIAVGINPVPVADLGAGIAVDVSLILHLSRLFGLPLTKQEAGELVWTISASALAITGTAWGVGLLSSSLKAVTGGLSTLLTGSLQAGIAYYATYLTGQVALRYFAQGKSWGEGGPKYVVQQILDGLDKDSILKQAKEEIAERLSRKAN